MANVLSIYFPFQQGTTTFPRTSTSEEDAIRASVLQILTISTGERVMRGTFGIQLNDQIFESDSDSLRDNMTRQIMDALGKWEPRIRVDGISVDTDEINEPDVIMLTVQYTIITSGQSGSVTIAS